MTGSIEHLCMYHLNGQCHLHEGTVTHCRLCFNFASAYRVVEKGKTKPFYTLYDYMVSTGESRNIFPEGNSVQTTL